MTSRDCVAACFLATIFMLTGHLLPLLALTGALGLIFIISLLR
ncbi:MAG: hypothetical protein ACKN9W_13670 [Methylococcus sp.]